MNRRKLITLLITLFCMIAGIPVTAMASYSDKLTVENHIQTGDIKITLEEYQKDLDGKESKYNFDSPILPGDTISKIPRITNLANPCYIRVHLTFPQNSNTNVSGLSDDNLIGITDKWIKLDDYYYYKDILDTGESVDFFHSVHIPESWGNEHTNQELMISIQVDAIQAQNFIPNFSGEYPWGNEQIEICAHNHSETAVKHPYQSMYVEFEDNSHKLLTVSEDFFSNLDRLMPGDTLSDTITLTNNTNSDAEFFFQTALPDTLSQDALMLLEQISLKITLNDHLIYEGNLKSTALEHPISLGTYKSQETGIFCFELSLPRTVKNAYALKETSVKWIFSVQNEELRIITPTPVKTGDASHLVNYMVLLISAVSIFSYLLYKKRKEVFSSC